MIGVQNSTVRHGVATAMVVLIGVAACATKDPPAVSAAPPLPAPPPDTVVVVDTVTVEREVAPNPDLERRVSRLSIALLEREALIDELSRQRDAAIQEVVRTMAKLQTVANRADAASALAEAKVAVQALQALLPDTSAQVDQATRLVDMSTAEFDRQNYGGSLYLATQAKTLARSADANPSPEAARAPTQGEESFTIPLGIETITRSNVRSGPGLTFEILYTVSGGTPLTGRAHKDEWILVRFDDGREGWIFYSLVRSRPSGS